MIQKETVETTQEALSIAIKEVSNLTDGKKDIYRFRKANPKIYKYVLLGIYIEKSGMSLKHLKESVKCFKVFRDEDKIDE